MVEERRVHEVTVVAPVGGLEGPSASELISRLRAHVDDEVIVDLRAIEPVPPDLSATIAGLLLAGRDRADACCVVARSALATTVARFSSIGDALQARTLAIAGYGSGWAPAA